MARTYEEIIAELDAKDAKAAAPAVPASAAPTTGAVQTKYGAVRVAPPTVAAAPKNVAPPAPTVTRAPKPVTPKVEKVVAPKPPKVEAPKPALELPPDIARPIDYGKVYKYAGALSLDGAVSPAASELGLSPSELKRIAQAQGVDLEAIYKARAKGRTFDEIAKAGKERGVIGFMTPEDRTAAFNKLADDVEKARKGDAGDTVDLVRSGADRGFGPAGAMAGYTFAGTEAELPEVAKPGEHGYAVAQLLVESLAKDPSAVRAFDLYGRSLATGGTQQYIEQRVDDLRKRANIKVSDADAMEKMAALRKRAINEVIAYKTVGQWTPVVTLGDVEVREGRATPGFIDALKPNIEIIGFNNKRQAVFRQESPMGVLFRAIDIPQAAVTGILSGQGAATGVQTGANLLEYALDATKEASTPMKVLGTAAGFAGSIIFPDMLAVGGLATKAAKSVRTTLKARKIAPEALDLLKTIAEARKSGDYARAVTAERELRAALPATASTHDTFDAAVARFLELSDPDTDIIRTDLAALLGNAVPEAAKEGATRSYLHPSARKDVLSARAGGGDMPVTTFDELYDTQRLLDRMEAARADYIKRQSSGRTLPQYAKDYVRGTVRDLLENAPVEETISAADIYRMADIVADKAPLALLDGKQFKKAIQEALKADATFGSEAFKPVRARIYKKGTPSIERKMADIRGKTIQQIEAPDVLLFERALTAIKRNSDARGIAAQMLYDEVASTAKLRVEPLNLFDEVAPKLDNGDPIRLSPGGLLLLHNLRKAFPSQNLREAYATVTMIDRMIAGAAKARDVSPFALYQEIFPAIRRGTPEDLKRLLGELKTGGPKGGAPAAPTLSRAEQARQEQELATTLRRYSDADLAELRKAYEADGVDETERRALDAIKKEEARRARDARKATAAADAERLAQLEADLEEAVQSGDEFQQGVLEMEIENLRQTVGPAPTPTAAAPRPAAPAAPAVARAPAAPAPATAPAAAISAPAPVIAPPAPVTKATASAPPAAPVVAQAPAGEKTADALNNAVKDAKQNLVKVQKAAAGYPAALKKAEADLEKARGAEQTASRGRDLEVFSRAADATRTLEQQVKMLRTAVAEAPTMIRRAEAGVRDAEQRAAKANRSVGQVLREDYRDFKMVLMPNGEKVIGRVKDGRVSSILVRVPANETPADMAARVIKEIQTGEEMMSGGWGRVMGVSLPPGARVADFPYEAVARVADDPGEIARARAAQAAPVVEAPVVEAPPAAVVEAPAEAAPVARVAEAPTPPTPTVAAAAPKATPKAAPKELAGALSRAAAMKRVSAAQTEAEKAKEAFFAMQEQRAAGVPDPREDGLRKLFDNAVARAEGYRKMAGFAGGFNPLDEIVGGGVSAAKLDELEAEAARLRATLLSTPTPTVAAPAASPSIPAAVEAQPTGAKIRGSKRAKAPKPEAAPVTETPTTILPSIERDARRADITRREKARQTEIMLGELYGRSVAAEWEEIPEQFRVNAGRRLNKAQKGLADGKITQEEFNKLVRNVASDLDEQKTIRRARAETAEPKRGPDIVRARLLAAKAEGIIDKEGVDLADWFIQQNPRIADNLAILIGGEKYVGKQLGITVGEDTAGLYSQLHDLVVLIKGSGSELTATHEVLHRTERMLPEALQEAIRKERTKQLTKAIETATDKERPFLLAFLAPSGENRELRQTAFRRGNLDPAKYYQFVNTSEFWAVNASRIVSGRYAAFNKGLVAKAKQWLIEFAQKVKSIFGLQSDAPLIRGLDDVLKGDGTFVSEEMLSQGDVFRSMEARANALRYSLPFEKRPVAATLFSGGGLVEAGLQRVVRPGYAVEARGDIAAHYGKVFGEHVENVDVRSVDFKRLADKNIGYLHASPVCKNFSAAKAVNAAGEQALDIETATATARAIDEVKPPVFTLENVADYMDSDALQLIEDALRRNGYTFDKNVFNAADYGAATSRKRLLLRAVREGELPPLPTKTGPSDWYARVEDLVDDLPASSVPPWMEARLQAAGIDWRNVDRPLMVAGGSAGTNVPYAFAGGPTFTIKATPKETHRIIMPGGVVKKASPRALARITGLPDDYPLPISFESAVTIIGNGVPLELTDNVFAPLIMSRAAPTPSGIPTEAERQTGPLQQVSPTGQVKGLVETLDDGASIIYLFEGADASTVLHEVAHVVRRNLLSNDEMGLLASWATGLGANVGHQYGEFTGDAADVEKAEEFFAKAFEQYVMEGKAPDAGLASVFEQLKQAVADVYKGVKDPVIGVDLQPEVRQVFDRLLATTPETANDSLAQAIRRGVLGGTDKETRIFDVLAAEAKRKGVADKTVEELIEQFNEAKSIIRAAGGKVKDTDTALVFPTPVLGKKRWTFGDLVEAQVSREERMRAPVEARAELLLDLSGRGRGKSALIKEDSAVESLWSAIAAREGDAPMKAQAKSTLRSVASLFFGGDIVAGRASSPEAAEALRNSPVEFRRALDAAGSVVEQGVADTVALMNDAIEQGNDDTFMRFLVGEADVRRSDGRPIFSSGHDKMGAFNRMVTRAIERLTPEERAALADMADAFNTKDASLRGQKLSAIGFEMKEGEKFAAADKRAKETRDLIASAVGKLLYPASAKDADFGSSLATAIRNAVGAGPQARTSHEWRLVETLTYIGGLTQRNGALFAGDSRKMASTLFSNVKTIYSSDEAARRVAILVGAFGGADQAKNVMVRMGLATEAKTERAFANFLVGEQIGAENLQAVEQMMNKFGLNVNLVPDAVLGINLYIPREARERMAAALTRATFRPSKEITAGNAFEAAFRYMKLRMTRGSFVIRQRYFFTSTVDHFNAMAYTAGFGVAAASTARVLMQDVMVIPAWREAIDLVRKTPIGAGIPADIMEQARSKLQKKGGDPLAYAIGKMMGVSKYRIEVNPILEGVGGGFTVGGKVYRYRDIRDIAVEESVFASFDTRELKRAVLREGQFVMSAAQSGGLAAAGKSTGFATLKNFVADMERSVTDISEAWSERERLGAMVTLMEAGYDPRTAARITTQALFNYSQSMTKADRSLLLGMFLPFWAFQKNANRQVFDLLFSPWGAYRMMAVKRMRERSADLATHIWYNTLVDEYGVDVESMPPELQDSYYAIVKSFEESYGEAGPTTEQKRALRMLLSGRAMDVEAGVAMMASADIQRLRNVGAFTEIERFAPFTIAEPSPTERTSIFRDRAGVALPFPRNEGVRIYNSLLGNNHAYMEIFWPDSTIEAGMKWHTQVAAAMILTTAKGVDVFTPVDFTEGGIDEVAVMNVIKPILDPERAPIVSAVLAGEYMSPPPRRLAAAMSPEGVRMVHPMLGKMMDDLYGTSFLRVPAAVDPFLVNDDGTAIEALPEEVQAQIKRLQDQYPDAGTLRDQRYYIQGGVWATAFDTSPLGELNTLLLRWEREPLERNAIQGEITRWARAAVGADVTLTAPSRAVKYEEPKKKTTTAGTQTF